MTWVGEEGKCQRFGRLRSRECGINAKADFDIYVLC